MGTVGMSAQGAMPAVEFNSHDVRFQANRDVHLNGNEGR